VLDADLVNGIGWCQSCGERASQESHAASAANGRVLIAGRRSPAEVRRLMASLDARMAQSTKDQLAELDRRMFPTSRRGAAEPPRHHDRVTPLSTGSMSGRPTSRSGRGATHAAPRPRPPNERRIHDPLATCAGCKVQAPGYPRVSLAASGVPTNYDGHPWFGSELDYRKWVRSKARGSR
jgi:hypothetical protein